MPNKTNKNLIPQSERTKEKQREIARMGGIASGQAKREKKTIQKIFSAMCESKCSDVPQFQKIANKLGLKKDANIKELFTLVSALNTLKTAKIDDLIKIAELLGEQTEIQSESQIAQTNLLQAIEQAVKNAD